MLIAILRVLTTTHAQAYLEFFVSPAALDALIAKINKKDFITYYAVNKQVGE